MMQIQNLPINSIRHRKDARPRSYDAVAELENSIDKIGLIHPLRVRRVGDGYEVISGSHRLQALQSLMWHEVRCIVTTDDDVAAEMAMIAENLHRAELSVLERDEQISRWVALNAEKVSQVATPGGDQPSYIGVRTAERELGIKRDDASRAIKVASLSEEAKAAARDIGLDNNRSALLNAARQPSAAAQVQSLQQHKAGGIAARFASADTPSPQLIPSKVFERFVSLVDEIEALPIPDLLHAAGRKLSVLSQRARGLAYRMDEIVEALDQ